MGALLWLTISAAQGHIFAIDKAIMMSLRQAGNLAVPIGPEWLSSAVLDVTALGGGPVIILITTLTTLFLLILGRALAALYFVFAVAGDALFSAVLKLLVMRPRPEIVPHLIAVDTPSFPSGHAQSSITLYVSLALLAAGALRSQAAKRYVLAVGILIPLMIGFTRVYLGVHWPSDVLAGWCYGALWTALCAAGYALALRRRGGHSRSA